MERSPATPERWERGARNLVARDEPSACQRLPEPCPSEDF
jgi:hypothetical protein